MRKSVLFGVLLFLVGLFMVVSAMGLFAVPAWVGWVIPAVLFLGGLVEIIRNRKASLLTVSVIILGLLLLIPVLKIPGIQDFEKYLAPAPYVLWGLTLLFGKDK